MAIGDNIKRIRKEKKKTQHELAEIMGISRSYLGDIENNRYNPSYKTIKMLAKALDINHKYLLEDMNIESPIVGEIAELIRRSAEGTPDSFNLDRIEELIQQYLQIVVHEKKEITRNGEILKRYEAQFFGIVYESIKDIDTSKFTEEELKNIRVKIHSLLNEGD